MSGVNKVILVGNLGNDPEVKATNSGSTLANFSVATSERWTKDGERHEKTEWHRVTAFGKLAEIVGQYVTKGSKVYIEGKIQTRSWETDSGEKRYATEIIARDLQMLDKAGETSGQQGAPPSPIDDDDLPF